MSYNKLNVFHWHITDTHSFPLHLKSVPELARYGAYSPEKTYSAKDVADLVNYARVRGVKVMPEFDAPAHGGFQLKIIIYKSHDLINSVLSLVEITAFRLERKSWK